MKQWELRLVNFYAERGVEGDRQDVLVNNKIKGFILLNH